MLANAVRICEAKFGNLWLRERDDFRIGATHGTPLEYRKCLQETALFSPGMGTGSARPAQNQTAVSDRPPGDDSNPTVPPAPSYLLTQNYRVILEYNCSNYYAMSVGLLADEIAR